jgi:death on curing protein
MTTPSERTPAAPIEGFGYQAHFEGPGRPTQLGRMIELAKMAWSPVLEMLGKEVRFEELDATPYKLQPPPMVLPPPTNGTVVKHWLRPDEVLRIHDEMITTFLGDKGVKDPGMIEGSLERMRESEVMGHDPIPTIFDKAAFLMHSILRYHPFIDGQKRTGLSSAFIFLGLNGYYLWSRDAVDEVHFAIQVAKGAFDVPDISTWIRQRVASRRTFGNPAVVDQLLRSSSNVTRRSCSICKSRLRLNRYLVTCPTCDSVYEVRLNAALVTRGVGGAPEPRIMVQPGLRLLGQEATPGAVVKSLSEFSSPTPSQPTRPTDTEREEK